MNLVHDYQMRTIIKLAELKSIEQLLQFIDEIQKVVFQIKGSKAQKYELQNNMETYR